MEDIIKQEKKYLETTTDVLNKLISINEKYINESKNEMLDRKTSLWDYRREYSELDMILEHYDMDKATDLVNIVIDKNNMYYKELDNPYFARVDFKEDKDIDKVYLGYTNVKDDDYYVYDWRAPIADLYYNYVGIGDAFYNSPSGKVSGEVTLRRQLKVEKGKLIRAFNSDVNIDDEYLQEILNTNTSNRMRNIVSSIQIEQNKVIRNLTDKNLIVQGIAGSGKTSIALHRISYLLYNNKNLNKNNVLFLSPNNEFTNYISEVLPSLGESNVITFLYEDFLSKYLKHYKIIPSKTIINNIIEKQYDSSMIERIKYLLSEDAYYDLKDFIIYYKKKLIFKESVRIGSNSFSPIYLNSLVEKYKEYYFFKIIDIIADQIVGSCKLSKVKYKGKVKEGLINTLGFANSCSDVYNEFLNSSFYARNYSNKINNDPVKYTLNLYDAICCLYIKYELFGIEEDNYIKAIVIDEAQDYNLMQIDLLKKIYVNADFTILGDINQCVLYLNTNKSLESFSKVFDDYTFFELTKSYRSTEDIIDYTNKILNINNTSAIHHSIDLPVKEIDYISKKELLNDIKNSIDELKKKNLERFLLVVSSKEDESIYKKYLSNIDSLDVLSLYSAKGLEYDGVFVLKDENINNKLFYIAATRAQRFLKVYKKI